MQILTFSTLYPSEARPTHAIFVETRLRKLVESGEITARVVAPCPWFPFRSARFGEYGAFARTPRRETRHCLEVYHPRYLVFPKLGMNAAPLALFAGVLPLVRRQVAEGGDFELIDAHYFYPDGVTAVMLGRLLRRPVVVTARGSDLNLISSYSVPRRWIQWAAANADGLITVSNGLKERLETLGTPSHRIKVLPNGVDLEVFRPADREASRRRLGFTRPTLLAVGNLVPEKRHHLVVEALTNLPDVELVIVGEGPQRRVLEAHAARLGVADRVHLFGRRPQECLPAIYSAADLLVHPSLREGWPNVLLESMACGTAVIAGDFKGAADIVAAPEAGFVLESATASSVAHAVHDLLAAPPVREATRRYAEAFDWQTTTIGQVDLFRNIIENNRYKAKP